MDKLLNLGARLLMAQIFFAASSVTQLWMAMRGSSPTASSNCSPLQEPWTTC